jgi:hypothetical protein
METVTVMQQRIADFLDGNVSFPRESNGDWSSARVWFLDSSHLPRMRPTPDELALEWLGNAEYRSLQLAKWLQTPEGRILTECFELVVPPFEGEDVELLVEALWIAANIEKAEGQRVAGFLALLALAGFFGALLIASFRANASSPA